MNEEQRKIDIEKVIIKKDLMPREKIDKDLVEAYAEIVDILPPIIINQNKILIDGLHRLEAHKIEDKTEINYIEKKTKDEKEIMEEAVKANSKHGKHLSMREKQKMAIRLFEASDGSPDYKKYLTSILSVSQSTLYDWIKDIAKVKEELFKDEIINTYLQAEFTEEKIAEKHKVAQSTVSKIINDLSKILNSENSIDEDIAGKYTNILDFKPIDSNIWEIATTNSFDKEDINNYETEMSTNILHRYAKPFDMVYVPNETVIIDFCKKWLRRYFFGPEMVAKPNLAILDFNEKIVDVVKLIKSKMKVGNIIIKCHNIQEDTTVFTEMDKQGLSLKNRIIIPKAESSFEDSYESLLVFEVGT